MHNKRNVIFRRSDLRLTRPV